MMRSKIFWSALFFLLSAALLPTKPEAQIAGKPGDEQLFAAQPKLYPFTLVAYGDLRTTHPFNHFVTNPNRRRALIARIAAEKPDLLVVNGDLVYKGGSRDDWREFSKETQAWRDAQIKVLPAIGNHEIRDDSEVRNYLQQFPYLQGRRWYSVHYGNVLLLTLDSESDDKPGSPQWNWIVSEFDNVPADAQFIVFSMHHPPYTRSTDHLLGGGHAARESEQHLAELFESQQKQLHARIIVIAGHVHNYERYEHNGVMYIVSGGGGATPYTVQRHPDDFYNLPGPTYHYCRITVDHDKLNFEMFKLEGNNPQFSFNVRDSFQISAK